MAGTRFHRHMLTLMLYGMAALSGSAEAMQMAPAAELAGTTFAQAAAEPAASAPRLETPEPKRVAEPATAVTLALGLSLLGLAHRRLPARRD